MLVYAYIRCRIRKAELLSLFQDRSGRAMSILPWRTTIRRTSISWSRTPVKCERYLWAHVDRTLWPLTRQSTASIWLALKKFQTPIDISIAFTRQPSTAKSTTPFTTRHKARNDLCHCQHVQIYAVVELLCWTVSTVIQKKRFTKLLSMSLPIIDRFLRATVGTARRVLAIVRPSVWLSVCHDPVPIQAQVR